MDNRPHQRVEHTNPGWRVFAIAAAAGGVAALGFWAESVGYARDFATMIVVALVTLIGYRAEKRPKGLRLRVHPKLQPIVGRVVDTKRDIKEYMHERPNPVLLLYGAGKGLVLVVSASLIVGLMQNLYTWHLAVAGGALVAAFAAAPHLFTSFLDKFREPDEPEDNEPYYPSEDPPDEGRE